MPGVTMTGVQLVQFNDLMDGRDGALGRCGHHRAEVARGLAIHQVAPAVTGHRDLEVVLHSEHGILGMGGAPAPGNEDYDLINAGKQPVTLLPRGAYFHHVDSFAMMRGGHLDISVLGAFQVSATGDLANWSTGDAGAIASVGGAMDLAVGAKQSWVMMDLLTKQGASKVVERCTYPLTGIGCVKRIYSDLATLECTAQGLRLIDKVEGLSRAELERLVGLPVQA